MSCRGIYQGEKNTSWPILANAPFPFWQPRPAYCAGGVARSARS